VPEGPEVECVVRQLAPILKEALIVEGRSHKAKFAEPPSNTTIAKIHRHGKWIMMGLSDGRLLTANLGMSGRFTIGKHVPKHLRWEMLVRPENEKRIIAIRYSDPRGFGHLRLLSGVRAVDALKGNALSVGAPLLGLGPDLLSRFMTLESTANRHPRWRKALDTSMPIKQALMDQSRLAGLGNIYAAEAAFIGKVHPARPANALREPELIRMIEGVPPMLLKSVLAGGTSFGDGNTYKDAHGTEGRNSMHLKVYGRIGLACLRCTSGTILQTKLGGRSTYHCNKCQAS